MTAPKSANEKLIPKAMFKARMEELNLWGAVVQFREDQKENLRNHDPTMSDRMVRSRAHKITVEQYRAEYLGVGKDELPERVDCSETDWPTVTIADKPTKATVDRFPTLMDSKEKFVAAVMELDLSDKKTAIRSDVEFVYQNVMKQWYDMDLNDVPSMGAVGLLCSARLDPQWFYATYHAKFLPSRSQLESGEEEDIGRGRQDEMIDNVMSALPKMKVVV